jgi:hypothetical protein
MLLPPEDGTVWKTACAANGRYILMADIFNICGQNVWLCE